MSSSNAVVALSAIEWVEDALASGNQASIDRAELQRLIAAAVKLYVAKVEAEGPFPAVPFAGINATEAMVSSSALLKGANVNVFELGLWQSWS
jgi:hypothetical protein